MKAAEPDNKQKADWFREQWHRLRFGYQETINESRKGRGFRL